mmetsp:Transcript_3762/g.4729  ORF Transcript_3762/g.4729 Transcript_3762/m.4729 type:complete len:93 (+) Transcript_3762:183-461(+)
MRKDELETKQVKERTSKVQDFRSSRLGEFASEDQGLGSTSMASGFAASTQLNQRLKDKPGRDALEKTLSASHTGDSLFANSTLKSPPEIDLP